MTATKARLSLLIYPRSHFLLISPACLNSQRREYEQDSPMKASSGRLGKGSGTEQRLLNEEERSGKIRQGETQEKTTTREGLWLRPKKNCPQEEVQVSPISISLS